jgi:hypothetical protein
MINASANVITLNSNRLKINSDKFTLTEDGSITATDALLKSTSGDYSVKIKDGTITVDGPWKALGEGIVQEMLVLRFHSAFGELWGLFAEGTVDDDLSFVPNGIYLKKIEEGNK